GTTRNEHRENYNQAKSYAENGIEHIIAHIEKEVLGKDIPKSEITSPTNVPPDNFQNYLNKFNRFLNDHKCQGGNPFVYKEKDGTLRYEVCFSNVGNKDDFRKTIKIQSTGHANGEERTIEADVEIGAEYKNYPSFLDFAVSTHPGVPPEEGKPDYRKETLILNGGLQIKGDVYTNGNIIVSNYAYVPIVDSEGWVNPWKKSTYPEIIGTNGKPATIYYNPEKSLFKMKSNQEFSNKPEKCKRSNETKGLIEFLSSSIGTVVN
ncbi:MAG: hypothetical protein GX072_03030, partial [Lysinibacillus sp.]|nr:hypothetical protein [Lysinibacillus sp.]